MTASDPLLAQMDDVLALNGRSLSALTDHELALACLYAGLGRRVDIRCEVFSSNLDLDVYDFKSPIGSSSVLRAFHEGLRLRVTRAPVVTAVDKLRASRVARLQQENLEC
jgi:hypothetical protein